MFPSNHNQLLNLCFHVKPAFPALQWTCRRIYGVHMVRRLLEKFHWSAGVKFPVMTPLIKYVIKVSNSIGIKENIL